MSSMKPPAPGPRSVAVAALAGAAFLALGRDAQAALPDAAKELGGIRLGMTMDEVKAAAAAHQPPLTMGGSSTAPVPGQAGKTFTTFINATAGKYPDSEDFQIIFSPPPLPSRVIGIRREMGFSPSKAPTQEYVQTSLREKFGGPPPPPFWGWVWTPSGAPVGGEEARRCVGAYLGTHVMNGYRIHQWADILKSFKSNQACGHFAVANQDARSTVSIEILDMTTLVDTLTKAVALEEAATKKKDDDAAAQAAKNRPKL